MQIFANLLRWLAGSGARRAHVKRADDLLKRSPRGAGAGAAGGAAAAGRRSPPAAPRARRALARSATTTGRTAAGGQSPKAGGRARRARAARRAPGRRRPGAGAGAGTGHCKAGRFRRARRAEGGRPARLKKVLLFRTSAPVRVHRAGQEMLVAGFASGVVRLFDLTSTPTRRTGGGCALETVDASARGILKVHVEISDDGKMLFAGARTGKGFRAWDLAPFHLLRETRGFASSTRVRSFE